MSTTELEISEAREKIVCASLTYEASCLWAQINPGDAHGADDVDMNRDMLDDAIENYVALKVALGQEASADG